MTANAINPIKCEKAHNGVPPAKLLGLAATHEKATGKTQESPDALLLAFKYIFDTMLLDQETANIQAKELQANASAQASAIKQEESENFRTFANSVVYTKLHDYEEYVCVGHGKWVKDDRTVWATRTPEVGPMFSKVIKYESMGVTKETPKAISNRKLESLTTQNEEISAVRTCMQNQVGLLQQGAQIEEGQFNSSVQQGFQAASQGSSLLSMWVQLTQKIASF